jgi:hypothetical protein
MLSAVIGGMLILAGLGVGVLSILALGMDPTGRGNIRDTIGFWPIIAAVLLVLVGLGIVL